MSTRCISTLALIAFAAAPSLRAQAPAVGGRVVTPAGASIDGADVSVAGTELRVRSDARGAFTIVNAPKGVQTLNVRRIGYLPASVTVRVPEAGDSISVTMVPSSPVLDTVQVVASLNVLAGVVIDSANRPVAGADVDMIGTKSATTTSDANGWFTFTSVRSGAAVVRVRKEGFRTANYAVKLDDWRGVVLRLTPLEAGLSASKVRDLSGYGNTSQFVWTETRDRLARRSPLATVVTREELAPYGGMALMQALRNTKLGSLAMVELQPPSYDVCILIDGRRMVGSTSLDMFRASEVAFVELYPPGTESSGTVARYLRNAGCRPTRSSRITVRSPFYAVVWLRDSNER